MRGIFHLHRSGKTVRAIAACGLLTITLSAALAEEGESSDHQWTMGGQNLRNWRNQDNTGINPHTVVNLKTKWIFTTGGDVSATPAVANGVVYFPDWAGNFYAVNAKTGALVWKQRVSYWTGVAGDFARNDPVVYRDMVILGDQAGTNAVWNGSQLTGAGARVMAVNAHTGNPIWVTHVETFPAAMVTSSPVVFDGIVYVGVASFEEALAAAPNFPCCVSRGSMVALDAKTGHKLWQTYTVPDNNGLLGGYSGGGIWDATPVIDPKRNSVYIGTGNNYSVPAAAQNCKKQHRADKSCTDPTDYFDAVVTFDLKTGKIKWANRGLNYDAWNVACLFVPAGAGNCPSPEGPDYDFGGSGPNLFTVATDRDHASDERDEKNRREILGIGSKSGIYWALNPDDGGVIWKTLVGPGSELGGIEWGTATDGKRIYVPIANWRGYSYSLQPSGTQASAGSWAALDPATGNFLWQTAKPLENCSPDSHDCMGLGPASVANGVTFAGSMDPNPANPTMFALDAGSGNILWSFVTGSSVVAAPAIVGNSVYWGSGYSRLQAILGVGAPNNKLFAFSIGDDDSD
jgi:polyvinyl alcohol dehydrogenase (cytochrome)